MTDRRQLEYLQSMGIDVWVSRGAVESLSPVPSPPEIKAEVVPASPIATAHPNSTEKNVEWDALQTQVSRCTACELHATRTQTVFGVGDRRADWMIIGEAPGADEDRQGEPFVGRAGQLLNAMLRAVGLERGEVYIANILKCRPPQNRDPRPEEAARCSAYLNRQIELVQPVLILALGRIAAHHLLQTDLSLARLRGRIHRYEATATPVVVSYHPAYMLRSPREKRKVWQDLQFAQQTIRKYKG